MIGCMPLNSNTPLGSVPVEERQDHALRYFRASMLKRFSNKSADEVEAAIHEALRVIAPSIDRMKLTKEVKKRLST